MNITEFLLARIAEDERAAHFEEYGMPIPGNSWGPDRVLAECEAKRRIVGEHQMVLSTFNVNAVCSCCWTENDGSVGPGIWPCGTLQSLAMPHSDHPDYQQEWAQGLQPTAR